MKNAEIYMEAKLGGDLYEVKMKIIPPHEVHFLLAVKRDLSATDLLTWHRCLGHLGDSMPKKFVSSSTVKGIDIMSTQLNGICEDCIIGKMDETPFNVRNDWDSQIFASCRPRGTNES